MKSIAGFFVVLWSMCTPLVAQAPVQLTPEEQTLMEAAYVGELDTVRRLVADGTSVDAIDAERRTPLMFASFNGHFPVVEFLLDAGAAIDAKDGNGRTALMYASSGPFAETVELLLQQGAGVNVQGTLEGFTPLMTAAAEGLLDIVRLLLVHGADRNLEDQDGDTALSFAKRNGHTEVVELLEMSPDDD